MKKLCVIDAGHGGKDSGARVSEFRESDITLEIARKAGRILEQHGFLVKQTRTDESFVSRSERLMTVVDLNPDAFVSIHCNAIEDDPGTPINEQEIVQGTEIYYRDEGDAVLADRISEIFARSALWEKHRGSFRDLEHLHKRLTVLNAIKTPSVLVELGFLTNPKERKMILQNIVEIAELLAHGIMEFLKEPENGGIV
jgi:N-acetylmuramoyl-L-alanine amidase